MWRGDILGVVGSFLRAETGSMVEAGCAEVRVSGPAGGRGTLRGKGHKCLVAVTKEVGGGRVGKRLGRRRASSIIVTGGEMARLCSKFRGRGTCPVQNRQRGRLKSNLVALFLFSG